VQDEAADKERSHDEAHDGAQAAKARGCAVVFHYWSAERFGSCEDIIDGVNFATGFATRILLISIPPARQSAVFSLPVMLAADGRALLG
jgi:hypothetical protein